MEYLLQWPAAKKRRTFWSDKLSNETTGIM